MRFTSAKVGWGSIQCSDCEAVTISAHASGSLCLMRNAFYEADVFLAPTFRLRLSPHVGVRLDANHPISAF